jgi:VWFA-related protein
MRALLRTPRFLVSALFLTTVAAAWPKAQNQAPTQPPRFKAGVEVMRVELTVLDTQTREPIRGLTASDFVIKVNGQPQDVVAFSEVIIPGDARAGVPWTREAARDVATNASGPAVEQRLIVIVMDDAVTAGHMGGPGTDLSHRKLAKAAAHGIINELGPHDLAAVLFVQFNQHAQDFTADRAALRRAVDTYNPQPLDPLLANPMSLGTLTRAGGFLAAVPERRRAIFYVTAGPYVEEGGQEDALGWSDVMQDRIIPMATEAQVGLANSMRETTNLSRVAQVPVYPISTLGVEAPSINELRYGLASSLGKHDNIKAIADVSGGRAVYNTNAPDRVVPAIFRELSSFYTLAYTASFPMDGKFRRLTVDVKHPGAMVEPDEMVLVTPRAGPAGVPVNVAPGADSGLIASIAGALPSGALPLRIAVAPFADAGTSRAAALVTLGFMVPAGSIASLPGGQDQSVIDARIFDGEGRKQVARQQVTAHVTPDPESASLSEVALRFDLLPGRYNARVGARIASSGTSGSVVTTFTVPDFDKEILSLSGVAIGRATTGAIGGHATLLTVLPFVPTSERTFSRTDIVGALVRVHQSSRRPAAGVTLETTITSDSGTEVSRSTTRFEVAQFTATRSVEHRAELALSALTSGDYLLTFAATAADGAAASRQVRFSVQ